MWTNPLLETVPNEGKMSWRLEKKNLWNLPEKLLKIHILRRKKLAAVSAKTSEMQDLDLTFERNFWQ